MSIPKTDLRFSNTEIQVLVDTAFGHQGAGSTKRCQVGELISKDSSDDSHSNPSPIL